jgi:precorrin-6Y C5,15-methyltransferase (decarboxylating)
MLAEGAGGRPWLVVVGIGADGMAGLGEAARRAVAAGEVLVGGARHLAMVPDDGRPRVPWRSPLAATLGEIGAHRGRPVVVLATGDPLWHGVGRLLVRHFGAAEVRVLPHVSAFQLAAARLGWALEEIICLSVHGRPLAGLVRHLTPGRRLLVLADDGETPAAAAALLRERGYGRSRAWVLEELGGPGERIVEAGVGGLGNGRFADLCTLALALEADGPEVALPVGVALPDAAFAHDGQLTKREVRAATLAALAPLPGELLWDVGAGAGGVAIDWLRADPSLRAVAVERNAGRAAGIRANAARLGVPQLEVVEGEAPGCLGALPRPDAAFVGGGIGEPGLLAACWERLRPGGRLVANAVTLAGEAALLAFHARDGGRLVRIALARAEPLGGEVAWRPALPVTQLAVRKPCAAES